MSSKFNLGKGEIVFHYKRSYTGKLQAIVHDWAGTVVDYGCHAPIQAVLETFRRHQIEPTIEETREPMGIFKKDHIRTMLFMPRLAGVWEATYGHAPTEKDVDMLYQAFGPIQDEIILNYATLIPGVMSAMKPLQNRGLKIGSCTGYTQALMKPLLRKVAEQGYEPDCLVTPDQTGMGRPSPFMLFENMRQLQVFPAAAVVKVGDTVSDIDEGLNAGTWTIGLSQTGNELGLNQADFEALDPSVKVNRVNKAANKLWHAGAHYVVNSFADILPILDDIESRLSRGEAP